MIVYSVTIKVDLSIHDQWLQWMKGTHLLEMLETGKFVDYRLLRMLQEDETDGITYNVQYRAKTMTDYFDYQNDFAPTMQKRGKDLFQDKFVAFRTLLKEVS